MNTYLLLTPHSTRGRCCSRSKEEEEEEVEEEEEEEKEISEFLLHDKWCGRYDILCADLFNSTSDPIP